MGRGWEFASQFLYMQYLLEKTCFAELVNNHVLLGKREGKGKREKKRKKVKREKKRN